jgi:hypothetical protein
MSDLIAAHAAVEGFRLGANEREAQVDFGPHDKERAARSIFAIRAKSM